MVVLLHSPRLVAHRRSLPELLSRAPAPRSCSVWVPEPDLPLPAPTVNASLNLEREKEVSSFLVPGTGHRACCSCWSSWGSPSYFITIPCTEGRPVQFISCLAAGIKGGGERGRDRAGWRKEEEEEGLVEGEATQGPQARTAAGPKAGAGSTRSRAPAQTRAERGDVSTVPQNSLACRGLMARERLLDHALGNAKTKYRNAAGSGAGQKVGPPVKIKVAKCLQSKDKTCFAPNLETV